MRLPVGEPLALRATDRGKGAVGIVEAELFAGVVTEIVFGQVPVQVLLFAVLVDAFHSTFEDGEHAFNRVGVNVAANVLFRAMAHGKVFAEVR